MNFSNSRFSNLNGNKHHQSSQYPCCLFQHASIQVIQLCWCTSIQLIAAVWHLLELLLEWKLFHHHHKNVVCFFLRQMCVLNFSCFSLLLSSILQFPSNNGLFFFFTRRGHFKNCLFNNSSYSFLLLFFCNLCSFLSVLIPSQKSSCFEGTTDTLLMKREDYNQAVTDKLMFFV